MIYRLLLVFSLVFVACSPAAFGPGSRANPLRSSITEAAKTPQNAETFIITNGGLFGISRTQADKALDPVTDSRNPQKGQKFTAEVSWFRTGRITTVTGIEVKLVAQTAVREVTDVGTTTFSIRDSVDLVFSVKVPATVPAGKYPILVEMINTESASNLSLAFLSIEVVAASTNP
jgi:hypothetical protein